MTIEDDGYALVTLRTLRALTADAAPLLGDPFAGLHLGASLDRGAYGLAEFVFRSAPTVREALAQLVRLMPLINGVLVFSSFETDATVVVEAHVWGEPACLGRHANEFVLANFLRVARDIGGAACKPRRVWLPHDAPDDTGELERFFGIDRFSFGAGFCGLELDRELLDLGVVTADRELYVVLDEQASMACPDIGTTRSRPSAVLADRRALRHGSGVLAGGARRLREIGRTTSPRRARHARSRAVASPIRPRGGAPRPDLRPR